MKKAIIVLLAVASAGLGCEVYLFLQGPPADWRMAVATMVTLGCCFSVTLLNALGSPR